jgi:predicted nucleic acid-binding protein
VEWGELVIPDERVAACRDPKDDGFLEAAIAGDADVIVSGDRDPEALSPFRGIPIVGPSTFLPMLAQS